jgi:Tol biopolymer transport system component
MKQFPVKLIIISLTVITLFIACDIFNPPSNPYSDKILFTSSRSGKNQIYMMNSDGSEIAQITSGDYWYTDGRWSQDHRKIVCNTNEGIGISSPFNIAVMNSDGSERALITRGSQMSWHPDGDKIIYSFWNFELGTPIQLFCINMIDTSINIIEMENSVGMGEFAPNGNKFLCIEADYVNDPPNNKLKIISYPDIETIMTIDSAGYRPRWSPNGRKIVFTNENPSTGSYDVYVMNNRGGDIQRITDNTSNTPYIYPCYSPDGKKILFLAYTVDGSNIWNMYMIDEDGTNLHKVISDSSVVSCDW